MKLERIEQLIFVCMFKMTQSFPSTFFTINDVHANQKNTSNRFTKKVATNTAVHETYNQQHASHSFLSN